MLHVGLGVWELSFFFRFLPQIKGKKERIYFLVAMHVFAHGVPYFIDFPLVNGEERSLEKINDREGDASVMRQLSFFSL